MDTWCKDRAGKAHVADLSANQGPPSQAGTVPFQVDEDRIGGLAISLALWSRRDSASQLSVTPGRGTQKVPCAGGTPAVLAVCESDG